MDLKQLNEIWDNETEIIANGITYKKINSIQIRKVNGTKVLYAELLDKCNHSVTIVPAKDVKLKG